MNFRKIFYFYRKYHNSIDVLSAFAGRYLAMAVWSIARSKQQFIPFGAVRSFTFWSGAEDKIYQFRADRLEHGAEMAMRWYLSKQNKAEYVAAVVDIYTTLDDVKTDTLKIGARFDDFSAGIIVYLPYYPVTENSDFGLGSPELDFPAQFASLAAQRERILNGLRRGRDTIPNREIRMAAGWK